MKTEINPVELAVQAVGTQQMLSVFLGVSRPTISYWKKNREIPNAWLERVQKVTQLPIYMLLSKQQAQIFIMAQKTITPNQRG